MLLILSCLSINSKDSGKLACRMQRNLHRGWMKLTTDESWAAHLNPGPSKSAAYSERLLVSVSWWLHYLINFRLRK